MLASPRLLTVRRLPESAEVASADEKNQTHTIGTTAPTYARVVKLVK